MSSAPYVAQALLSVRALRCLPLDPATSQQVEEIFRYLLGAHTADPQIEVEIRRLEEAATVKRTSR